MPSKTVERIEEAVFALWDLIPDCLIIQTVVINHHIRRVNAAFTDVLGWTQEEVAGLQWDGFLHPDELPYARQHALHLGEVHGRFPRTPLRWRHRDGRYVTIEWAAPAYNGVDAYTYAVGQVYRVN